MVVQGIHIEHVTLKLRLPLYCYKCRRPGMSEVLTVALEHVAPDELAPMIATLRVGTHFPQGWASHLRRNQTVYDCPTCVAAAAGKEV